LGQLKTQLAFYEVEQIKIRIKIRVNEKDSELFSFLNIKF